MGTRPALVISHDAFNRKMGFVFVCPVSNTTDKNPFYVSIEAGKKVTGVIMADQLRSFLLLGLISACLAHIGNRLLFLDLWDFWRLSFTKTRPITKQKMHNSSLDFDFAFDSKRLIAYNFPVF